ncbi:MAG: DMT family transporter [Candidatus Thorarchaeota archaeon]|nr:DMT family transporter [Candidatus Thorarchaeota archaeon]
MQLTPDIIAGSIFALLGSTLYAFSVVIYRSQSKEIRPLWIASIKMWVALGLMTFLFVLPLGIAPFAVPIESTLLLITSVVLGAVVGDTVYLISQERIGVSYAFPISMSFPILTYFLTIAFLGEPLILSRLVGVVLAVSGIVLLSREQKQQEEEKEQSHKFDWIGVSLAIVTAVLYAVGTTVLQVGVTDVEPVAATFIRAVFGSIAFAPMVAILVHQGMPSPTRRATKVVAIAGFFGMALGSILYVSAVKYAGAAITSVLASTAPLWAVPISIFYLKESISRVAAIGILATIAGVILVVLGI